MLRFFYACMALMIGLSLNPSARASSYLPTTTDEQVQSAEAIFRGQILSFNAWENPTNGHIFTTAAVRVDETFKGQFPPAVNLTHSGGTVGNRGEMSGSSPQLKVGEERLFFVARRSDGTLYAVQGGAGALKLPLGTNFSASSEYSASQTILAHLRKMTMAGILSGSDVTDQAADTQVTVPQSPSNISPFGAPTVLATNLLEDNNGIPPRFLQPDRGEPIPYLIDADHLPAGMSLTNAVTAVKNALAAWTAVTSLRYQFMGLQSFGQASANITNGDGYLRIQLHDAYNFIGGGHGSGDILGEGGAFWLSRNLSPGWTMGGNVNGTDFNKSVNGYVVLSHTNTAMQSLSMFTEVLTHEIGHTIGLAHSSENPNESNAFLKDAIMYYMVHGGGRGATLGAYDPPVVQQVNPLTNTPPYMYDRYIDVVTVLTNSINVQGVNSAQLRGYDLQTTNLTFSTTDAINNPGTFKITNNVVTYTLTNYYSDSPFADPRSNVFYDIIYVRCSDGTNASPYASVQVSRYYRDSYSEGIPDSWRVTYFGNANPATGSNHHATNDLDGDGYNNLTEFLLGSSPVNKSSNLRITNLTTTTIQWQAKPFALYEILGSTNLSKWVRVLNPVTPTTTNGTATVYSNTVPFQFFRVEKVP